MNSIDDLEQLTKGELLARWQTLPGKLPPPPRVDHLLRELAYRLQEQSHSRLDKNTAVKCIARYGKVQDLEENGVKIFKKTSFEIGIAFRDGKAAYLGIRRYLNSNCPSSLRDRSWYFQSSL